MQLHAKQQITYPEFPLCSKHFFKPIPRFMPAEQASDRPPVTWSFPVVFDISDHFDMLRNSFSPQETPCSPLKKESSLRHVFYPGFQEFIQTKNLLASPQKHKFLLRKEDIIRYYSYRIQNLYLYCQ
jgi:hypothetical protein